MKKILIISPYFVPVNAADMHRVRQSLEYYEENGWVPEVVMVNEDFVEGNLDNILLKTIPNHIKIHKVSALNIKLTRKIGLGNIGFRSMYYYYKYVNALLIKNKYDLIFFSTTQYAICILGRFWKRKFNIPFIIDLQDPWRSDHYLSKPSNQRPPKFWFSYCIDALLELLTMKYVDGLLSVSQSYIDTLKSRYSCLMNVPTAVVPFAAYPNDFYIANSNSIINHFFNTNDGYNHMVYIGRGGHDMQTAGELILSAFKKGLTMYDEFEKIRLYFIGTSYDTSGKAKKSFYPIAEKLKLSKYVTEVTDRVSYFESIKILQDSTLLMIPGSDNFGYTASKIYGYVWLNKPMFTVFHSSSSVNQFMRDVNAGLSVIFDKEDKSIIESNIIDFIFNAIKKNTSPEINWMSFEKYTARYQVKMQVQLFNNIILK